MSWCFSQKLCHVSVACGGVYHEQTMQKLFMIAVTLACTALCLVGWLATVYQILKILLNKPSVYWTSKAVIGNPPARKNVNGPKSLKRPKRGRKAESNRAGLYQRKTKVIRPRKARITSWKQGHGHKS